MSEQVRKLNCGAVYILLILTNLVFLFFCNNRETPDLIQSELNVRVDVFNVYSTAAFSYVCLPASGLRLSVYVHATSVCASS